MKKNSAYKKDIWRSIWKGKKRFFAIMIITVLGTTMFSGLKAACVDLRHSADNFFDSQRLFDLCIMSTLGLTDEDLEALSGLEGVEEACGVYSETVHVLVNGSDMSAALKTYTPEGINQPYVVEGHLPESSHEVAITEKFSGASGLKVGDSFQVREDLEEDEEASFASHEFQVAAIVIDVLDVNNAGGTVSFRSSSTEEDNIYILPGVVNSDIFTAVYITLEGSRELFCYSQEYEAKIEAFSDYIESEIKEQRTEARTEDVRKEAYEELEKAKEEVYDELQKAEKELLEGEAELKEQLKDAEQKLLEGESEFQAQMEDAREKLLQGERDIQAGLKQLEEAEQTLNTQEAEANAAFAEARRQIEDNYLKLETGQSELNAAAAQIALGEAGLKLRREALAAKESITGIKYTEEWEELDTQAAQLEAGKVQLAAGQAEINSGRSQLNAALLELEAQELSAEEQFTAGRKQIAEGRQALESGRAELIAGWAEYESGMSEGESKLEEGRQEYEEGKAEGESRLEEGWLEYEGGKAEAEEELEKAGKELADMDMAEWYIQNRNSLGGYSNIASDADSIESIGTVFPIVFFVVAVLISLTTITRMVEEDRGLIGTYKALGFHNGEIRRKYLLYALCASAAGSILGTIGAFVVLPGIIFYIFSTMYLLPGYEFLFEPVFGLSGPVFFVGGIVAATMLACRNELIQTPVALMRPKTPRSGSRVLLERIPFIWNSMSFLNKVTARNLFRYKKRLIMTVSGIMGCMALLLFGFAIKDSVTDLVPRQYEETFYYDAMAVSTAANNEKLLGYLNKDSNVDTYLNAIISSVKLENKEGGTETVQLIVAPDGEALRSYVQLRNIKGKELLLEDGEIALTQNAALILDIQKGDQVELQTMELDRAEVSISNIVQNYLGNYIYMTKATYEQYFGDFKPNGALIHISEHCPDPVLYCNALGNQEGIVTCVSTDEMKEQFSSAFTLINMVVYIVIIMAACLAFAVLFTLATTNISERIRELATIKVLGFYDNEVHSYVNKETMILTGIGILLGVPLGYAFAQTLTIILALPSIYLAVSLHPVSYLMAGGLSLAFALIVNMITNRSLNEINPVEALKSVE